MIKVVGKAMWYFGLGYLISVLGFAVIGFLTPDDMFWTYPYFVHMVWYQKVANYVIYTVVVSHSILVGPLIVVSAVIGVVVFCLTGLVIKVLSGSKGVYRGS